MTQQHPVPQEAMAESIAIVGRTGSGKTYTARGMVERQLSAGARVCIVDPTSVWWGLRSLANGKPAFPVVIFGGDHGDIPLEGDATEGKSLGEFVATTAAPTIVDVASMTMGGRTRFMAGFLDSLHHHNRAPLTLVIDEADLFAPQRAMPDQTVMFSRMEHIARRGRVKGFRLWMITQRPAELHKSVLSQANTMIAMRMLAPQDRNAIGDWIEGQVGKDEGKRMLAELPKLQRGEGYVWAPSHDILQRVQFPPIRTWDSMQAPEAGTVQPLPPKLADVDLAALRARFAASVEKAAADDPKALRARIATLEAQIEQHDVVQVVMDTSDDALLKAHNEGYCDGQNAAVAAIAEHARDLHAELEAAQASLSGAVATAAQIMKAVNTVTLPERGIVVDYNGPPVFGRDDPPSRRELQNSVRSGAMTINRARQIMNGSGDGKVPRALYTPTADIAAGLGKAERAILIAAAQRHPKPASRAQLSILSGYSSTSSSFSNACGALRTAGYLEGRGDDNRITAAGIAVLGSYERPPRGRGLIEWWAGKLGKAERSMLHAVTQAYPKPVSKATLSKITGYSDTSSSFSNALGKLRSLQLIEGRGEVRASDVFFHNE